MLETLVFNVITTLGPLILAIAVHEWAHVAMARFLGDDTGTRLGRYTLDPLRHIDPFWTVGLPLYFVVSQTLAGAAFAVPFMAAGKPAPYTPVRLDRRFNGKRISMGLAELLVAVAGPLSNLVLALVTTGIVILLVRAGHSLDPVADPRSFALLGSKFIVLNTALFLFNLIPVAPLDGSKVVVYLLPMSLAQQYRAFMDRFGTILLIVLFIGGAGVLLAPVQRALLGALWSLIAHAAY